MQKLSFGFRLLIFILINFGALAIGAYLMGDGPRSNWYQNANQAPWTPPGWVFGAAWFTIMACFSFYMAKMTARSSKRNLNLYILLTLLNIGWNPLFFWRHEVGISLVVISMLTLLLFYFVFKNRNSMKSWSILVFPYLIWLIIATSLNAYFLFNNP
jgi:benzodiazapine receptor